MIFDYVITSESSSWKCQRRHATSGWRSLSPPRHLASVSRAWRTIVFACPMLWRHVVLTAHQPIHALEEHLRNSSPLPIHLTVHKYWPFRNSIPASGPYPIVELGIRLRSIAYPKGREGSTLAPACRRVESITINATESCLFLSFVLTMLTGRDFMFPALRHVAINGNACATWSTAFFFDGKNAPTLDRLELSNVVISYDANKLLCHTGLNLTTLVWTAPAHEHGSLVVSLSCFHHVVSSLPSLTKLELHGHVVGLEFVTLESLESSSVTPLKHVRELRISGQVFSNGRAALVLFYLLPSLRHVAVRGRACSGPIALRTVMHALRALTDPPKTLDWPIVLPDLEDLELKCLDGSASAAWITWYIGELELWRQWRETIANSRKDSNVAQMRIHVMVDKVPMGPDEEELGTLL